VLNGTWVITGQRQRFRSGLLQHDYPETITAFSIAQRRRNRTTQYILIAMEVQTASVRYASRRCRVPAGRLIRVQGGYLTNGPECKK